MGLNNEFHERDRQGQFSSLLIVFLFCPLRSAPTDPKTTIASACGWAVQSAASSSQLLDSICLKRVQAIG